MTAEQWAQLAMKMRQECESIAAQLERDVRPESIIESGARLDRLRLWLEQQTARKR